VGRSLVFVTDIATGGYRSWAQLYDAFYQRALGKDYAVESAYIAELIVRRHGQQASVLDVACGTGMHLSLMPTTFTLAGIDREPAFLEIASTRVPCASFTQGRMEALTVGTKVDAITCMFSSIGHLSDVSSLRETCRRFAAALVPGGTVIIEPWILPEDWKPGFLQMLTINEDHLKAARTGRSVRTGNKSAIYYAFAVTDDNNSRAFEEAHVLTLFSDAEYRNALEEAGFDVERRSTVPFQRGLYVGRLTNERGDQKKPA
jgi:SAM-dependent methyltransferase